MAGAGYKLFATGDVLTAAEVNTYLQQQVTMVFANSTARTTALSGVLAEGMMSYLQDTNTVEVYNGSNWVNVGNTGDVTEVQAGTGISVADGTGPIPIVTNTMATEITAKGDLIVGTGSGTFDNLPVGTNGYTLVADSSVSPQGLKWAVDPVADVITTAGDLLYGTAADTVARLGIGTAGQFLAVNSGTTAPEWVAAPSAGADWSLVNSGGTNLTGAATVTVSGISGADKLMIIIDNASSASANAFIGVRLNADTGSNYNPFGGSLNFSAAYSADGIPGRFIGAKTFITIAGLGTDATDNVSGYALFSGCNSAGLKVYTAAGGTTSSGSASFLTFQGGYYNSASTISSVSAFSSSGNLDAGKIWIYKSA